MKKVYFSPQVEIASLKLEAIMDDIVPSTPDIVVPSDIELDDLGLDLGEYGH